ASRSSAPMGSEAGADGGDGGKDAPACTSTAGGNDLSFDLSCKGYCLTSVHFDYHLDRGAAGYPGCVDGKGNLQFPKLTGSQESTFELGIATYTGPGKYTLESPDFFSFGAMLMPDGDLPCMIQSLIPDPDVS